MKLVVQIEISHDLLGATSLVSVLPSALESVAMAVNAGIAETGGAGMQVEAPGTSQLAQVHFRMRFEETGRKIEDLVAERETPA